MISTYTYKQPFYPDSLTFELAKESGAIYTKALNLNKKDHKDFKQIVTEMSQFVKGSTFLHSQSAQAAYESFIINLKSYFKALKEYKKNPKKFSGQPKPPHRNKFLYKITFKKSAIRYLNGEIWLSVKKPHPPIKLKWNINLGMPIWAIINYNHLEGWSINFVLEKEVQTLSLDSTKTMSIDLGVKRIATTFDGTNTITYSGKKVMSFNHLRNKLTAKVQSKKAALEKKSRKWQKIQRANRRIVRRIKNQEKDILHKYSRMIVHNAIQNNVGKIVIGDNASTHNKTNTGKENQKIQQNPEQQLRKYVEYKFNSVGGTTTVVPEQYTSRTCPGCNNVKSHSVKGRTYCCKKCGFVFDRDGVGAVNIYKENVSFDHPRWLDVVGGLTPPIGVKHTPRLSLVPQRNGITNSVSQNLLDYACCDSLEEPHVL